MSLIREIIITDGADTANVGANSALDVNVQDPITPPLILPMAQELASTTLALDAVVDAHSVTVTSPTGIVAGMHFRIINSAADRFYSGTVLSIAGSVVQLDTPIDFLYLAGSEVTISNINMAVNGSVTPVVFTLRTGAPSIPSDVDITRLLMVCECNSAVDLNKFGDLTALTRGLVFRETNDAIRNILNVKTNRDLVGIGYDWTPYTATNPAQGIDGFGWRLTFGGQSKIGTVLRITPTGNLQMIIQDDLTGLVSLIVILEGHSVQAN